MVPLAFGWRDVLFANWPADPDAVAERLPDGLSVETYDGDAWLTVVPFVNVAVRPRGLPRVVGVRVPEVNLRTYVVREGAPGVYFFSLDAESVATVLGGRVVHHLPYFYARIDVDRGADVPRRAGAGDDVPRRTAGDGAPRWGVGGDVPGRAGAGGPPGERVRVRSRRWHPGARPAQFDATYGPAGEPSQADPGSRAAFLTERRRLYTRASDGTLRYTDVSHESWPLSRAAWRVDANTLFAANGFDHPGGDPLCYYSPGVDVVTSRSRRWGDRERADQRPADRSVSRPVD